MKRDYQKLFCKAFTRKGDPYHYFIQQIEEERDASGRSCVTLNIINNVGDRCTISEFDFFRQFVMVEPFVKAEPKECKTCDGAGIETALRPSGHTEITCLDCDGSGVDPDYEESIATGVIFNEKKCDCGIEKIGGGLHSDWCSKYKEML